MQIGPALSGDDGRQTLWTLNLYNVGSVQILWFLVFSFLHISVGAMTSAVRCPSWCRTCTAGISWAGGAEKKSQHVDI